MTTDIQVFNNSEFGEVRTLIIDGEPWFAGKDVAAALGYANATKAVIAHVDEEDKRVEAIPRESQNGTLVTRLAIINESGLYSLILSSKLPKAKEFKRWVTSEVLPAIRKTGHYAPGETLPANTESAVQVRPLTPDDYIAAARIISKCRRDRLPIVMELLRKGEWDLGKASNPTVVPDIAGTTSDISAILRSFTDTGGTLKHLSELTGINAGTMRSYRLGYRSPTQDRYNIIVNTIAAEIGIPSHDNKIDL